MDILDINEQEDGSAILEIDMTQEEMRLLMEVGLNKVLADYIKETKHVPVDRGVTTSDEEKKSDN